MSNITWGAEIKTPNGRPYGLEDDERCLPCWGENTWYYMGESTAVDCVSGWERVTKIRLPANHRFYHKLKEYDVIDIEDWAIEAAKNDAGFYSTLEQLKAVRYRSEPAVKAVLGLARMIQKHEQYRKPVDPDFEIVRATTCAFHDAIRQGDNPFQAALTAYKAAKS